MTEQGFHIFLPSNASPIEFPNNKVNHFRVRFEKPISLRNYSQWEVALIELSYVHSLQTIRGDETMELVATKDVLIYDVELSVMNPLEVRETKGDQGLHHYYSYWFYPPNSAANERDKGKFCFYLAEPGTRAELSSRYAMHLGFKKPYTERKFPKDYTKPTEPPPNPPTQKQGQTADQHKVELNQYAKVKEKYKADKQIYDNYCKEEQDEPPFQFYHTDRQLDFPDVNSETCNQYDFSTLPLESMLPYPKLRVFKPAAGYTVMKTFKLHKGHYRNTESLLKEMKGVIGDNERYIKWSYFESNNRFSVTVNTEYHLRLHPRLASVLGFKIKDENTYLQLNAGGTYEAELTPDLLRGTYHMYVYTDMTELSIVGHQQAALLRAVPLQDVAYGTVKSFSFNNPIYSQVSKSEMETVEVMLCDDAGELLPLGEGKTFMVLHFRPRQI